MWSQHRKISIPVNKKFLSFIFMYGTNQFVGIILFPLKLVSFEYLKGTAQ